MYCSARPEDSGCAFVHPLFERVVGEATSLGVQYKGLSDAAVAKFIPAGCECGLPDSACAEDGHEVQVSLARTRWVLSIEYLHL